MKRNLSLTSITAIFLAIIATSCTTVPPASPSPTVAATPVATPEPTATPAATPAALATSSPAPISLVIPATSRIQTESAGFSPLAEAGHNTIQFDLSFGNASKIKTWRVDLKTDFSVQKTFKGDAANLPSQLTWNGKTDAGNTANEGTYTAQLTLTYVDTYSPGSASSSKFLVDILPPNGKLVLSQSPYSPIEVSDSLEMTIVADSKISTIDSWSMKILDPAGNVFQSFDGKWPVNKIKWDGKNAAGERVESAEDYPVEISIRDGFGNTGTIKSVIPVDILVEKVPTGYRILSSRIFFKAYTDNYIDVEPDLVRQNIRRLDQLSAKLKKFPGYTIRIVGHAVMENWDNPTLGKKEQEKELIPLSIARAKAVMEAMIHRGLADKTLSADGVGAADQLVLDSDLTNRWRNRRVAFFLDK